MLHLLESETQRWRTYDRTVPLVRKSLDLTPAISATFRAAWRVVSGFFEVRKGKWQPTLIIGEKPCVVHAIEPPGKLFA
jgi:hypothetical protein